jgi:hypothetical protein
MNCGVTRIGRLLQEGRLLECNTRANTTALPSVCECGVLYPGTWGI